MSHTSYIKKDSKMATSRSRKNPTPTNFRSRLPHVNTTQREGDFTSIFAAFFKDLNALKDLPNGFELISISEPRNILDGAFLTLQHENMTTNEFFPFMDWIQDRAARFGISLYDLPKLPSDAGILVLRLYIA